jgi:hypothetical protein
VKHDGRALTEEAINRIQKDIFNGLYLDQDISRLFESLYLQRKILRTMFNLFHREPLRLVSVADPLRNSILAHYKELVSMEDDQ